MKIYVHVQYVQNQVCGIFLYCQNVNLLVYLKHKSQNTKIKSTIMLFGMFLVFLFLFFVVIKNEKYKEVKGRLYIVCATSPCNKQLGQVAPRIQTSVNFWEKSLQLVPQNTLCELFVGQVQLQPVPQCKLFRGLVAGSIPLVCANLNGCVYLCARCKCMCGTSKI